MSTPKQVHIPPRINREDFRAGYMKPESYSLEDISSAIVDHLSRKELTERQLDGLAKFNSNRGWTCFNVEDPDNLKKWFDIFSSVYFNGILGGYCKMGYFPDSRRGKFWNRAAAYCQTHGHGYELDPRFKNEIVRITIGIKIIESGYYNEGSPEYKIRKYRNSLVHELLHAAFGIYACKCKYGCSEKFSESLKRFGGHDMPWMAAACAIRKVNKAIFTEEVQKSGIMGVSLNLDLHAMNSLVAKWDYIPPDTELRRLGLDITSIRYLLAWHREKKAKAYRKDQQKTQLRKANRCLRCCWIVDSNCKRCNWTEFFPL